MLHVIIVSHNSDHFLVNLLSELTGGVGYDILVRDNVNSTTTYDLCNKYNTDYMSASKVRGFAVNNNIAANHVISRNCNELGNYFLFINPDIFISKSELERLAIYIDNKKPDLFTIDLYLDDEFTKRDPSIRKFPSFMTFMKSFLFDKNNTIINRNYINEKSELDWCASSFFGIQVSHFFDLKGFDPKYYMYCEDIDICKRAKEKGKKLTYYSDFKAIHYSQHGSNSFFSKNFIWHLSSVFKYLLTKS